MRAVSIADKKSIVPILSHVLLDFGKTGLIVRATDLEISIIENVVAEIDTFGIVAVPAGTLGDILRKIPDSDSAVIDFSLTDNGNKLSITTGKSKFELSTLEHGDFPTINLLSNSCEFRLNAVDFNRLISRTRISISPEENRHNLNGIFFHKDEGKLVAASTDGHRLSVSDMELVSKENIQGVIISKKTVFEVKKLLDTAEGEMSVIFSANQVQFSFDKVVLISKLVDGVFPEYKHVIPEMSGDFFTVKRTDFIETIDRVSVMSDDKVRAVKLELSGNSLFCSVVSNRLGSGRDEVSVSYTGQGWSAGFNASYLLDVAQTLNGEELKIYVKETLSPILIVDESEPQSLFVIMPMRI